MYGKLILRSAKRSIKDYLIYIVTLTLCVTMFYSFLSISSSYYHPDIGVQYNLNILSDGMKTAIGAITLLLLFLIKYVNNYMIRCKQKKFAIQTVMGMEQKTTANLFFLETLIMGLVALCIGIILGTFCSQFTTAMLLSAYGQPFSLSWMLYPDTVLLTVTFFSISFVFIGLLNIHTIRKIKVIDMLNADKENEPHIRKSKWMPIITIIFSGFLLIMLVTGIFKRYYYFDSRMSLSVHLMFWGNILIPAIALTGIFIWILLHKKLDFSRLVIFLLITAVFGMISTASVPVLQMKYYLALGTGTNNTYMIFLLAEMIYVICAVFYIASNVITSMKEKSLHKKYYGENLFFFGQIISKLRTTTKTMTLICLTLVLSISMFLIELAMNGWVSGYLATRSVFDVQVFSQYNNVYDIKDLPDTNYDYVTEYLDENNIQIKDYCTFNLYLPRADDFHQRIKWSFPVLAISLSDYNHLLGMKGLNTITLKSNEFTTQWRSIATEDERNAFLDSHSTIQTDVRKLELAAYNTNDAALGEYLYNKYTDVVYVLPDEICEQLLSVNRNRSIQTVEPLPYDVAIELQQEFEKKFPAQSEGVNYYIRTSTEQINSTTAANFVMQASMTYGAVVLLIMCFTILALQQLLDATHYKYRFSVLRKLGVEETQINKLVLKQLGVWFGLPIGIAMLASAIFGTYFFNMISSQISAYIGTETLVMQILLVASILLILLTCYFVSTWILFSRTIRKQ